MGNTEHAPMGGRNIRGSVIIPAHNEASNIAGCLDAVMASSALPDLDVVVVCNGCDDDTATIARRYSAPVRCLETPLTGKHHALELGRRHTADGHRLYLDADVVVSPCALSAVLDALDDPAVHGAAPAVELEVPADAPWVVRRYASVWRRAPYFADGLIGSGFYGLDPEAQRRVGPWPALIADDLVALGTLATTERVTTTGTFTQRLESSVRQLIRAEIRREAGRIEYDAWSRTGCRSVHRPESGVGWLTAEIRAPSSWLDMACFVSIKVSAKLGARRALHRRRVQW